MNTDAQFTQGIPFSTFILVASGRKLVIMSHNLEQSEMASLKYLSGQPIRVGWKANNLHNAGGGGLQKSFTGSLKKVFMMTLTLTRDGEWSTPNPFFVWTQELSCWFFDGKNTVPSWNVELIYYKALSLQLAIADRIKSVQPIEPHCSSPQQYLTLY